MRDLFLYIFKHLSQILFHHSSIQYVNMTFYSKIKERKRPACIMDRRRLACKAEEVRYNSPYDETCFLSGTF